MLILDLTRSLLIPPSTDRIQSLHKPVIPPFPFTHLVSLGHVSLLADAGHRQWARQPHRKSSLTGKRRGSRMNVCWLPHLSWTWNLVRCSQTLCLLGPWYFSSLCDFTWTRGGKKGMSNLKRKNWAWLDIWRTRVRGSKRQNLLRVVLGLQRASVHLHFHNFFS